MNEPHNSCPASPVGLRTLIDKWRRIADTHEGVAGWGIVANAQRICAADLEAALAAVSREEKGQEKATEDLARMDTRT